MAILFVIFFHFRFLSQKFFSSLPTWTHTIFENFSSGVDLFFVLSGFLVYGGLLIQKQSSSPISISYFFSKRILRIFPAYFVYLAIVLPQLMNQMDWMITHLELPVNRIQEIVNARSHWWVDVVYLSDYIQGLNEHTWSLSIEEKFYILLPFLCLFILFRLRVGFRVSILFLVYILPLIFRWIAAANITDLDSYMSDIYRPSHTRFDALCAGMLAAEFYKSKWIEVWRSPILKFVLLGLALILLSLGFSLSFDPKSISYLVFRFNLLNSGYACILVFCLCQSGGFFAWNGWIPIARLSYGMYLWHLYANYLVGKYLLPYLAESWQGRWIHALTVWILVLLISLVFALVSYIFVEIIFLKWKDRLKNPASSDLQRGR